MRFEIGGHHDRGNLLRSLHEPTTVEPTNNAAERALRPAVIARKVSHCSKNGLPRRSLLSVQERHRDVEERRRRRAGKTDQADCLCNITRDYAGEHHLNLRRFHAGRLAGGNSCRDVATKHRCVPARKLLKCGGSNPECFVRIEVYHRFGSFAALSKEFIQSVSAFGRNACR